MPRIMFATDGSEASLRAAHGLAGILGWWNATDVEILNVQPEPTSFGGVVSEALRERAESRVRETGERALASARAIIGRASAGCTTALRFGEAAAAIAHAAETLGCEAIAMGTHGAGAAGSLFTGSVTTKVIHIGTRPVLVIPSTQPADRSTFGPPYRPVRVLVPFDGSEGALAALDELLRIAPWFRDPPEVHLLSVYEGAPFDVEIAGMVAAGAVREHEERQLEAALAPARKRLAGTSLPVVEHTAVGPAADQIRAAGTDRCDLICMGSRGAGAIRQLVVGSTTTKVLRAVPSPVLVVSGGAHRAS